MLVMMLTCAAEKVVLTMKCLVATLVRGACHKDDAIVGDKAKKGTGTTAEKERKELCVSVSVQTDEDRHTFHSPESSTCNGGLQRDSNNNNDLDCGGVVFFLRRHAYGATSGSAEAVTTSTGSSSSSNDVPFSPNAATQTPCSPLVVDAVFVTKVIGQLQLVKLWAKYRPH
nr:hypothetical protein BaRGS_001990 [Batillaria attramentaria]